MKIQQLLFPVLFFFFSTIENGEAQPCTCTNCPVPITDNGTFQGFLDVTVNGPNDLGQCPLQQLCFTIEHTWIGDLSVTLTSPSNLNYMVMADKDNNTGGCGTSSGNVEVCIDTGTGNPLTNKTEYNCNSGPCSLGSCCLNGHWTMPCGGVTDPVSGAVQAPTCDLNDFNVSGHQANGTWTLTINDICGADVGFLHDWSLVFACGVQSCTGACQNPPTAQAQSNSPVCEGDDIFLDEIGGQAVQWNWNGPNGFTSTVQNPTITGATSVNTGMYQVIITDMYGCTNTDSAYVFVAPSLQIGNIQDSSVCEWAKLLLMPTVSGGSGSYSCAWSPAPGLNNPFSCTPTFQSAAAGSYTYTLTVTDNTYGCTTTKTITITNENCCSPTPTGCTACNSVCTMMGTELVMNGDFSAGDVDFTSSLGSNCSCAAGTYCVTTSAINKCPHPLWQHIKAPDCSGNYLVVDGANGIIWQQSVPVQPNEEYNFSFDYYPNVSGGGKPTLELWVDGGPVLTGITGTSGAWESFCTTWLNTHPNPTNVSLEIRQVVQAQYSDYGIDNISFSNCESNLMVVAVQDTAICANSSVQLNTIVTGNSGSYSCTWSPTPFLSDPNICDPVFTPSSAGTYVLTVTVMDADSCSNSDEVTITVYPQPNVQIVSNAPICEGDILQFCEIGGDAVSWSWTGPNGFSSNFVCPAISPADPSHSGTYCVEITDANGCTDTDCINVDVFPGLMLSHPIAVNICEWTTGTLSPTITGGSGSYSCSWSPASYLNNPLSCTPDFFSSTQGTVTMTMTVTDNATGCMDAIQFDVNVVNCCQPTTNTCSSCPFDCFTQGGDLVVNGDFSGGNTGFTSGLTSNCNCASGTYCVSTNARNKCTNSFWKPIYSPNCNDNYLIVDGSNTFIWRQTVTPTAGSTYNFGFDFYPNVSDGTSPVLQLWVGGVPVSNSITAPPDQWSRFCADWMAPAPATPVVIEIRQLANGYRGDYGIDNIEFTECIPPPSVAIFSDTTICENETIVLSTLVTGGAQPVSCQWMPTAGVSPPSGCNPNFKKDNAGVYPLQVVVTDDAGCTDTATVTITVEQCCDTIPLACNACNSCTSLGNELIVNGDFSQGNTGFTSSLSYNCTCAGASYCVADNARDKCQSGFWQFVQAPDCGDFMIVDGANGDIWKQTGIPVTAGQTYNFSFALYPDISASGGPTLELRVDNVALSGSFTGTPGTWTAECATYTATQTGTVDLSLVQIGGSGFNDYGIDMISFRPCGAVPIITLADTTICASEDLVLTPIITGGSGSYTCNWSPGGNLDDPNSCNPTFNSGATGVFTYTLSVTDNTNGCSATETISITVTECCTPVSTYCNACLNACTGPGPELVFNGSFLLGNTGFTSGLSANCSCASSSYCIGNRAHDKCTNGLWQNIFAPDCDSFMIVDGGLNGSTVWEQANIPVTAGEVYNFSFALYPNISGNGGPTLELRVDNTPIHSGGITGNSGTWTGFCEAYTATTTTTVTLSIVQTGSSGFNDFGIDQVSFRQCDSDPMVTITPVADFCESGSAVLNTSITGGTGTPTCQWSPTTGLSSSTDCNPTVSGLSAGSHTYSVIVTDPSGCTATSSVSFTVNATPMGGISNNNVCEGGPLNLGVLVNQSISSYQWAGPAGFGSSAATPSIPFTTQANAGVYSVTVTSTNGCTAVFSKNIPVNVNNAVMTLGYNAPVCHNGTLNLTASGPPMSAYSWTGPNSFSSNLQNPSIPNATQATNGGTYQLTVTDANGCTKTWSLNVTIKPPTTALALSNSPICEGQQLTVYETGGDAVSWNWSGPSGFSGSNQVETIANATAANAGQYSVSITDADGCTQVAVTNVTVFGIPQIANIQDTAVCEWDFHLIQPFVSGGSGNYSCSFSPSANLNNPNSCNPTFQSDTAGTFTYTLTVTDNQTGCTATKTFTITVDDCCTPITTSCNACQTACQGNELVIDGDFNSLPGNANVGSSLPAVNGCSVGSYWITNNARAKCNHPLWNSVNAPDCGNFMVVDGNNGTIWSQTVNVTAGSTYNFGFDFYPDISSGTSPTLQLLVNSNPILSGITAPLATWTGICQSYTATSTGSVLLEIRQTAFGYWSDYGIDKVTFKECLRGPDVAIISDTTICETDCITLTTNVTNAGGSYTCSWSPAAGLNDPNLCSPTACGLSPGVHTYVVTVTDSAGCVGTNSVNISVKPQPSAIAVSNGPICEGDGIQLNEIGGNSVGWTWSGPNGFGSTLQSPVIPNAMNGTHDGTYTVIVENSAGCKDTATVSVVIYAPLSINGLADSTVCEGEPVLLSPIIGGGSGSYTCSWSPSPNLNNAGSCTPTFNATNAGIYTFTLTVVDNQTGCFSTATVTMTAEICCTPTQTGCTACSSFCGSTELVTNGDFSGGDTGFSSGLPSNCGCSAGSYCVDDNARDKCTSHLWKSIRSPDCTGNFMIVDGANGIIWEQTVPVTAGNTYFFGFDFYPNVSDGASPALQMEVDGSPLLNNITAPLDRWTSHCASWTASTSGNITIRINQTFHAYRSDYGLDNISFRECYGLEISALADTTVCTGSPVVLTTVAKGGTGQVTCQWSPTGGLSNPNDCNPTFTPTLPGTYTFVVTGTDSLGCTDTDTVIVTAANCCPLVADAVGDTTICDMDTAFLDVIVSGAALPYSCAWTPTTGLSNPNVCNPFVTLLPNGSHTYYVTVTDSLGCTATDSVVITVGNCCLVLTGPTIDPFNLNNFNSYTQRGMDLWDVNADGIEDIVYSSNINGPMSVHLNTGTVTSPNFSATSTSMGINAFGHYNIDYNQDGFMDFFAWITDQLHYFENLGTVNSGTGFFNYATPVYVGVDIPPATTNKYAYPAIGDLNNDGLPDVIVATHESGSNGNVHYYENTAVNTNVTPSFSHIGNPLVALAPPPGASSIFVPEIFDGDCDGDMDLFIGRAEAVLYYENGGAATSGTNPDLNLTPVIDPFGINGITLYTEQAFPRFVEIDDDNNVELFVQVQTDFLFFENACGCPSGINQFRCAQSVLNLGGNPILPGLYQAIEEINSGDAFIYSGMTVDYRAGNGILLESNFDVALGAKFSADIEECGTPFAPSPTEEAILLQGASLQTMSNTQEALHLQLEIPQSKILEIQLFDIQGKACPIQIKTIEMGDMQKVRLEQKSLPAGVYFLSVRTEKGEWRERVVVQQE